MKFLDQLTTARRAVVEARKVLRESEDDYQRVRAMAEQECVNQAGDEKNLGPNAEARARAIEIFLAHDIPYLHARDQLHAAQAALETALADVDCLRDLRRERESEQRDRLLGELESGPVLEALVGAIGR